MSLWERELVISMMITDDKEEMVMNDDFITRNRISVPQPALKHRFSKSIKDGFYL